MTAISLPIFGQGSQPLDEDGAVLEYLSMPQSMATYTVPALSSEMPQHASMVLTQLLSDLAAFPKTCAALNLQPLDTESLEFINQALGEGEVSILYSGQRRLRIQESVLAGVWRLHTQDNDNHIVGDTLEVGCIPQIVAQATFTNTSDRIDTDWEALPPGVMNAPALLTELNAKIIEYRHTAVPHTINLSLLPQTEEDLAFLAQRLGKGAVTILSRGYGNCRISATATENVWWVQYFNSQDVLILNTLEVASVPCVACAAEEDIADSRERLQEILEAYV